MRRSTLLLLLFILLLAAGAAYVDAPNNGGIHIGSYNNDLQLHQGLDLEGGVQVLLQASCSIHGDSGCKNGELNNMGNALDNIQRRVNGGLGVSEPVIRQQGTNRISVELPGLKNEQEAVQLLGQTGKLEIINTGATPLTVGQPVPSGSNYPVVFTGDQLDTNSINAILDPQSGQPEITFQFKGSAQSAFANYTQKNVGNYLTITLDGTVIESAVINSQITGQGIISGGSMTLDSAQKTAALLRYGALPVPLQIVSEEEVGATLGKQSLYDSLVAGVIGLGIVILFMLFYYRLPGFLADVALILYAGFTLAIFKLLSVVLTLAGFAGFILSIGMAVDANILIFERVKEELRGGRTLSQAIDVGFKRAWPSIRDSNISTMITCGILYWFGSNFGASIIVGFATTLFLGVVISLFTAITVTRTFLNLLVPTGVATHPALFGVPRSAIAVFTQRRSSTAERRQAERKSAREPVIVEADEEEEEEEEEKKPKKPDNRSLTLKERLALRKASQEAEKTPAQEAEEEEDDEGDEGGAEDDEPSAEDEEAEETPATRSTDSTKQETARAGSKRGVEE
jgi:preprotein translocase subunit SecD